MEEHFVIPEVVDAWQTLDPHWRDLALAASAAGETGRRLLDLGEDRLAAMDETGLDIQVLSLTSPGVQNLASAYAVALARASNDVLAEAIRARPDRLQGLATLATPDPVEAANELDRAVTRLGLDGAMVFGRTRTQNLDAEEFLPVLEAAAALRAPLYLHPQSPVPEVRAAYYSGFDDVVDAAFATHGIGWHYENGVQLVRLILAGVFDRYPDLQVIVGHWGELVLFYLERIEHLAAPAGLQRPITDYFRENIHVTGSGMLSQRYLRWATEIVGPERIMFSTDYPFVPASVHGARRFLDDSDLNPADRERIASGNWERLRTGILR